MDLGSTVLVVYGALLLVGGIVGYASAQSRASLIAGTLSAVVLAGVWWWSRSAPAPAYWVGAVVSLALALSFGRRYAVTGKLMPSGLLLVISLLAMAALVYSGVRS